MIKWLTRVDRDRPFLKTVDRVWSYGEAVREIAKRMSPEVVVLRPSLDADSVFAVVAALSGPGAVLVGPGVDPPEGATASGANLVMFTSGSTGEPKGVRLTMGNLEAASLASMAHTGHGANDTWLLTMALHHVAGLSIVVRSALAGGAIRLLPGFEPQSFARALHGDVTMVSIVPPMLRQVLDVDAGPYENLRAVLVGGGPIPDGLLELAADAGLPVLPTYGMTETFGQVATLDPGDPLSYRVHPLPGVDIRIEDDRLIQVRGAQVSPGYLGETNRISEWYVTSDLGAFDEDGALRIIGRADLVIVSGGENVDPVRVENEIRSQGVTDVVVVGVPDVRWGQLVTAIYEGNSDVDDVVRRMREKLPRFMIPTRWVRVDRIPRVGLGKPDRAAALDLCLSGD